MVRYKVANTIKQSRILRKLQWKLFYVGSQGCSQDRLVWDRDRKIFPRPRPDRARSQFWLQDRDRQRSRPRPRPEKMTSAMVSLIFWKKFSTLKFVHKLVLWLYKLIQITNCFCPSDYFIKTSRRCHFLYIFTKIIFEECLQLNLMPLTRRSKPDHLYFP